MTLKMKEISTKKGSREFTKVDIRNGFTIQASTKLWQADSLVLLSTFQSDPSLWPGKAAEHGSGPGPLHNVQHSQDAGSWLRTGSFPAILHIWSVSQKTEDLSFYLNFSFCKICHSNKNKSLMSGFIINLTNKFMSISLNLSRFLEEF